MSFAAAPPVRVKDRGPRFFRGRRLPRRLDLDRLPDDPALLMIFPPSDNRRYLIILDFGHFEE